MNYMSSLNLHSRKYFGKISLSLLSTLISVALLLLLVLQNSPPSSGVTSPFTNSTAKIESVSKNTTAANYNVGLKYSQQPIKKGEPAFFMVDMSSITNGEYIRMRHVDSDFVILRDKQEMYKLSSQYGEPQFHSINGIMLASFDFKDVGTYTISIKITGELFIPISPVFANFSVVVAQEPDGNKRITIT